MPAPTAARPGASCGNDDMTAFRRFDPYAILAKADREQQPLAALAGLAAATTKIENDTEASVISNSSRANKNRNHGGAPAKVANPAKVDEAGTFAPLAALADPTTELEISAQWGEAEEERAAIIECDGKSPRAWAEGFARLDPDRRPATCRRGAGCGSSTTLAGFSIARFALSPQHSVGDRSTCSGAIGSGLSPASVRPGFCGS